MSTASQFVGIITVYNTVIMSERDLTDSAISFYSKIFASFCPKDFVLFEGFFLYCSTFDYFMAESN